MLNQSFRQVFVAKTGTSLLADGATVDTIVEGQIGILDGNTYVSETTPTYATNKAIYIVQGTPAVPTQLMAGFPHTNQYSKLIKGRLLTKLRRKNPTAGQAAIVAIGYDGVDNTKTLFAKCGDVKTVFLTLTGNPIDKLYSNGPFQRQYKLESGCCDECGSDTCADIDPEVLADALVLKINTDPTLNFGNGQLVTATKVTTTVSGVKKAGVLLQSAFVKVETDECTYDYFPYEADILHIQVGEMNHDYNGNPCEARFVVTQLQDAAYPTGGGQAVYEQEKTSVQYFLKERSVDPGVRLAEGYKLFTDRTASYTEFVLEFAFKYKVLGWSQEYTDNYQVSIFVVDGSSLETALNTALTGWATAIGDSVDQELN